MKSAKFYAVCHCSHLIKKDNLNHESKNNMLFPFLGARGATSFITETLVNIFAGS